MLYSLLDGSPIIETIHLEAALSVWRYCDDSARIIFGNAGDEGTLEGRIIKIVRQRPGVLRSEIRKTLPHHIKTTTFNNAIRWLTSRCEIVGVPANEGSKNGERFYLGVPVSVSRRWKNREETEKPIGVALFREKESETTKKTTLESSALSVVPCRTKEELITFEVDGTRKLRKNGTFSTLTTTLPITDTETSTLTELLEWRNANAIRFVKQDGGSLIWVTKEQENLLTPALASALKTYQDTISVFVDVGVEIPFSLDERRDRSFLDCAGISDEEYIALINAGR